MNICPTTCMEEITADLGKLGIRKTDTVLIHSAMSSLGHVEGGAPAVIAALLDAVSEGTAAVPTLTGCDRDGPDCPPVFDPRTTPCWTGRIPETFRQDSRAIRSLHPTHSVAAIGRYAQELTAGHEQAESPCDTHSPYYKLAQMGGKILLLGVNQQNNTTMHCVEELAGVPYHLQKALTTITFPDREGHLLTIQNRLHDWNEPHPDFMRIEPILLEKKAVRIGRVANSTVRLVDAAALLEIGVPLLQQNPTFLI